MKKNFIIILILCIIITISITLCSPASDGLEVPKPVDFSCDEEEASLIDKEVYSVSSGNSTVYIGYKQVSDNNQDPRIAMFTDGVQDWCRADLETTGDDSRGYVVYWDGNILYASFSSTGTQGDSSQDFRRFATDGWITSYGQGGGAKIAVITKINPINGDMEKATYLKAVLSNGNANTVLVKDLVYENGELTVKANSWYSPLNPDKSTMSCSGDSPFDYTIIFNQDLSEALSANAKGCQ